MQNSSIRQPLPRISNQLPSAYARFQEMSSFKNLNASAESRNESFSSWAAEEEQEAEHYGTYETANNDTEQETSFE